mmetsp:Transcript_22792/g.41030  ORF Transcript_22792/g.41030 Transcript_22792/m.41030 type:complete len:660 (-) Transcript_22792:35-2014(-)
MTVHPERTTFTGWFWSAIQSATGFTPTVVEEVKNAIHSTYEIPERSLADVKWTDQGRIQELINHLSDHLRDLQELREQQQQTGIAQGRALPADFLTRKKFQLLLDRVKATRPSSAFLFNYFESLNCQKCKIETLDKGLLQFRNLREVSFTGNRLRCLEHLPQGLEIVNACANRISEVGDLSHNVHLRHIGLSYNELDMLTNLVPTHVGTTGFIDNTTSSLPTLTPRSPATPVPCTTPYLTGLVSLDLGFNRLTDLPETIQALATHPHLLVLVLQGNPLALVPKYREYTLYHLMSLRTLDDVDVSPEEQEYRESEVELDPSMPQYAEVTVVLRIPKIEGLAPDPDAKPVEVEIDTGKGGKKGGKEPPKGAGKKDAGKGGKGKNAAESDEPPEPIVTYQTCVYLEGVFAGRTITTPEVPKQPRKPPAEGEAEGSVDPVELDFMTTLTFGPEVVLRDALLRPAKFQVWEVFKTLTLIPDPSLPEEEQPPPTEECVRQRIGHVDVSFADVLLPPKVENVTVETVDKMQANEFIHIDHLREEAIKQAKQKEESTESVVDEEELRRQQEEEERKRREEEEAQAAKAKGKKAAAKPAAKGKPGKDEPSEDEEPKEIIRYYNPMDLDVRVHMALSLNPTKPATPEPVEEDVLAVSAATSKSPGKKKK